MSFNFKRFWAGLKIVPKTTSTADEQGDLEVLDSDGKLRYHNGSTGSPVVTEAHSAILTNKDLVDSSTVISDASDNTIEIKFDAAGTTGTSTTLLSSQTANRILTLPNTTDTLATLTQVAAKVTGPAGATDNVIARFDGTTGKVIQNSGVIVNDSNVLSGATQINVDNLRLDGNTISNTAGVDIILTPQSGQKVSVTGNFQVNKKLGIALSTDNTTTGAAAILVPTTSLVRLTDAALESIEIISSVDVDGQVVVLINNTGSSFDILDGVGSSYIKTGSGNDITIPNNGTVSLAYNSSTGYWHVIGSSSAGSSDISFTVANNQAVATDVTGLTLGAATYRGAIIDYTIYRQTNTAASAVAQIGQLRAAFDSQNTVWFLSDDYSGQNAGVTFTITSLGQIRYTSTNIAGANYTGTFKYNIRKLFTI